MITLEQARKSAVSLPETEDKKHFHIPDFQIRNKIFSWHHTEKKLMMVKLTPVDQSVFCSIEREMIFPVPGRWGKKDATFIYLKKICFNGCSDHRLENNPLPTLVRKYFPGE